MRLPFIVEVSASSIGSGKKQSNLPLAIVVMAVAFHLANAFLCWN
ncbi:hypothetical protein ABEX29_25905 [Brevibacillus porteri]|nr:hypothetical protein [Brevibacillus sp. HB1.1]